MAVVTMVLGWIHWGLSLILGAIFAREMGKTAHREGIEVHYPVLCVAGYMGLGLTWHWGLSGSAPLLLTDATNIGEGTGFEFLASTVPATETILHPYGILLTIFSIVFATLVLYLLAPTGTRARGITDYVDEEDLFVGLLIYLRQQHYRDRFGDAARAAAGIVLLFPFFAGIQGMMSGSGLATDIAQALIDISTTATFPVFAWLSGAVVNLFVPSGGGEWLVLGPSILQAAQDVGVPIGQATMAYAVGDAHTNLLNPFWAIPLLAITEIKAREMFGYGIAMLLALIPFLAVVLFFLPYSSIYC